MNAVEATRERRPCIPRLGTRTTPTRLDLTVTQSGGTWNISQDPLELHNDGDHAHWGLGNLITSYPGATFEIEFTSGPSPLDTSLGPFVSLGRIGSELVGDQRINNWGCYIYDIWVKYPGGDRFKLPFTIDPQIDNLAPPVMPYPGDDDPGE